MKYSFALFTLLISFTPILFPQTITRLPNGAPSTDYWQQRADYSLAAVLDPEKNLLSGKGTVTYYNNSPDTLTTIVWHLYQNIFRKDSSPRKNNEQSLRASTVSDGITVSALAIGGVSVSPSVDETLMETLLPQPLLPKTSVTITMEWSYDIPNDPDLRTGRDGDDFGICQWYPQIAVYDDLRGWNRTPYLGIAEFYTEFGDWNVEITLPKHFIVASTGTLLNPADVLTPEQLARFSSLSRDSTTRIIRPDEISRTADTSAAAVWKFSAANVRDFAFAASPDFVWDGTVTNAGTKIYAFYKAEDYRVSQSPVIDNATNWDFGAEMAKRSIEYFSALYGEYVYPQATVVSGPVLGMEYPMMVFIENGDALSNLMNFTIAHELAHQWYPMMIGSDETRHPFMDEGFATYITSKLLDKEFPVHAYINADFAREYSWMNLPDNNNRLMEQRLYLMEARENKGSALMSHSYDIPSADYGTMAYAKPGTVLVMLEDVLGTETFTEAMREYYRRWRYKHPSAEDFFRTMEDVAGRDLDWFWNPWFYQTWKLDIAVDGVKNEESNGIRRTVIALHNREQAKMPATLRLTLANGETRDRRFSETVWSKGQHAEIVVDSLPAAVTRVVVDPENKLADVDRMNNFSSLPPVVFDYGFNIMNNLFYPLDAYRINAAPALNFNLRDGVEIGTTLSGNSMGTDNNLSLQTKYGTRSGVPDLEIAYSTPLRMWDPQLTTAARIFRWDGFSGWEWEIEKTFDLRKSLARSYRRTFVISTSILSIRVNDVRYLGDPAEWNTAGVLDAGFIDLKYFENFSWGKISVRLADEFGTPTSAFSYSKLTSEMIVGHSLFGMSMNWRVFGGTSTGAVPVQTAHSLTQASPLERFGSWFFRTPVAGREFRGHFTKSGGGNLFLERDTVAANVAALNVSLSQGPLVIFADAGTMWDSTQTRFKQFFYDAGLGLQISIPGISLPAYSTGPIGFGLYFPVFVRDPARPNDTEFAYRWRIVLGVRL